MLQTTQTKIREELREQVPPVELHQRILTQIEVSGISDEPLRRERARGGLIPRRYLPFAIVLSTVITAAALFPMVAHLREKARQASLRPDQRIGLALLQYSQDYDETFPSGTWKSVGKVPAQPGTSAPTREVRVTLQVRRPETAADTILAWGWDVEESYTSDTDPVTTTIFINAVDVKRLLPKLQTLGKTNLRQIYSARALAAAHPSDEIEVIVEIIPEKTR